MKKFSLYQIRDEFNGRDIRFELGFGKDPKGTAEAAFVTAGTYEMVAVIYAPDLNGVFQIGNIGPEQYIERVKGQRMASVSVGDIIVDSDTFEKYLVSNFGFTKLFDEEVA